MTHAQQPATSASVSASWSSSLRGATAGSSFARASSAGVVVDGSSGSRHFSDLTGGAVVVVGTAGLVSESADRCRSRAEN